MSAPSSLGPAARTPAQPGAQPGTLTLIGLGSSLGDRHRNLRAAVRLLSASPELRLVAVSRPVVSRPVGRARGWFLNAVLSALWAGSPEALLARCQWVERRLGRAPTLRWSDRLIDVDIIVFGDERREGPGLVLPHPRMSERNFVLVPAAEVAGPLVLPSPASAGGRARVWPRGPALTTRRWCCRPVACGAPDRTLAGG